MLEKKFLEGRDCLKNLTPIHQKSEYLILCKYSFIQELKMFWCFLS